MKIYESPTKEQIKALNKFKNKPYFYHRFSMATGKIWVQFVSKDEYGSYVENTTINRNGKWRLNNHKIIE